MKSRSALELNHQLGPGNIAGARRIVRPPTSIAVNTDACDMAARAGCVTSKSAWSTAPEKSARTESGAGGKIVSSNGLPELAPAKAA